MKTTKLFALVLSLFLLALPLTSCTLGADGDLVARLDSMEALISQQNATIEGLNAKLTEQSSTIAGLNAKLGEQSSTIAGQNTIINGLNAQLFEQNTVIGNFNSKFAEQNSFITGQNSIIDSINAKIAEQNALITDLNSKLSEQSSMIGGLNAKLAEQSSTVESLNTIINEQNTAINGLDAQIAEQNESISDLDFQLNDLIKKETKKRILLTKDNYKDYIAFNITFSDSRYQETPGDPMGDHCYMCNMTITTYAKAPGISFEGVSINYAIAWDKPLGGADGTKDYWITQANQINYDQKTDLSFEGYSQSTFHFFNYSDLDLPWYLNTHQSILNINSITGYVIITE